MKVVIFTSPTCIPCRQLKPTLMRLQEMHGFELRVVEASAETQAEFERYGIRTVPTVICLNKDGEKTNAFVGAQGEAMCENYLRKWEVIK